MSSNARQVGEAVRGAAGSIKTNVNQLLRGAKPLTFKIGRAVQSVGRFSGFASGGFLGRRGMVGPDFMQIAPGSFAAPGEAVLRRHQQEAVEQTMSFAKALGGSRFGSLDELFAGVRKPHMMQRGGRVQEFQRGGWRGVAPAGINPAVRSIARWAMNHFGATATSTVRASSTTFHSPQRRAAVDLVSGNMLSMARGIDRNFRPRLAELIHSPLGYSVKFGRRVPAFAVAHHFDHVHVAALGRALVADVRRCRRFRTAGQGLNRNLARLWIRAGGPRNVAHLMGAIAMAESGGNPRAHDPSGASGLWQILGLPFPGNPFDPLTSLDLALR